MDRRFKGMRRRVYATCLSIVFFLILCRRVDCLGCFSPFRIVRIIFEHFQFCQYARLFIDSLVWFSSAPPNSVSSLYFRDFPAIFPLLSPFHDFPRMRILLISIILSQIFFHLDCWIFLLSQLLAVSFFISPLFFPFAFIAAISSILSHSRAIFFYAASKLNIF